VRAVGGGTGFRSVKPTGWVWCGGGSDLAGFTGLETIGSVRQFDLLKMGVNTPETC
jgi:hypothetical protein